MVWTKLDDGILDHPKVSAVGPIGFGLFVASIVYSNRNLTDGFVPYGVAGRLLSTHWTDDTPSKSPIPQPANDERGPRIWQLAATSGMGGIDGEAAIDHAVEVLCRNGLWTEVPHGYVIHDFEDWNPSRETVLAEREKKQAAGRAGGLASAQARAGASAQAKSKPVPVPVPVPEPEPQGQEQPAAPVKKLTDADVMLAPDSRPQYFVARLTERDKRWRTLRPPVLMKLSQQFSPAIVIEALSYVYEQPDAAEEPYPYLLTICRRIGERETA
jgi:hypothetical protein